VQIPSGDPLQYHRKSTSGSLYPKKPNNILIWAHGYRVDEDKAKKWFATVYKRLYHTGYRGGFVGVTWEGDEGREPGGPQEEEGYFDIQWINSFQSASALVEVIKEVHSDCPYATINLSAHSLGNNVLAYALRLLAKEDTKIINNVIHTEAAIPGNVYSGLPDEHDFFNNMYGIDITAVGGKIYNSYSINDWPVNYAFTNDISSSPVIGASVPGIPTPLSKNFEGDYVLTDNTFYRSSESGGLGGKKIASLYNTDRDNPKIKRKDDKFSNFDSYENKRTWEGLEGVSDDPRNEINHPYNICTHSSMMYDYYYDVQEFYKFLLDPEEALEDQQKRQQNNRR